MRSLGNGGGGGGGGGGAFRATSPRAHALASRVWIDDAPKRCFPLALRAMMGAGGRGGARWCEESNRRYHYHYQSNLSRHVQRADEKRRVGRREATPRRPWREGCGMETVSVCPLRPVSGCFWTRAMDDVEFCTLTIRRWHFTTCFCARLCVLARSACHSVSVR